MSVETVNEAQKSMRKTLKKRKQESSDESSDDGLNEEQRPRNGEGKTEEELQLESLVFGAEYSIVNKQQKKKTSVVRVQEETIEHKPELADNFLERKPAWQDDDDEKERQMSRKTAALYSKHFGTPVWADLDQKKKKKSKKLKKKVPKINSESKSSDDEESEDEEEQEDTDDDELFQQTGNFLATKKASSNAPLAPSVIDVKICTDANFEEPQHARLKAVEFHPNARVILTGGLDQKLNLFQVDGKKNPKIQSVFIDKFPIFTAHFTRTGDEIIIGSRHKSFYYYDMIAGKMVNVFPPVRAIDGQNKSRLGSNFEISPDNRFIAFLGSYGQIHLFSVKSKEYVDSLKVSGSCEAIAFSSDSRYLFTFGDDNAVNVFDMNHRGYECLHKFNDFGSLSGTSIAVSNNSQFIATGYK